MQPGQRLRDAFLGVIATSSVSAAVLLVNLNTQFQIVSATVKRLDDNSTQYVTKDAMDRELNEVKRRLGAVEYHK